LLTFHRESAPKSGHQILAIKNPNDWRYAVVTSIPKIDMPKNEPIYPYGAGSKEKTELKAKLRELSRKQIDIPCVIGGRNVRTGKMGLCVMPHDHKHVLGSYHKAGRREVESAIKAALAAKKEWSRLPWEARAAVFLRAADLLAGEYRSTLNAATMLGQSKTVFQAEIDSACELIDFFRFNTYFMRMILAQQPESSAGVWDINESRPLDGFVFAVTPFNFTSIAGNLPTAPAIMGNTVVWKPASSAVYSAHFVMQILKAAGLPDGVINMIPGPGSVVGDMVLTHPDLSGVHFTGSMTTLQKMWEVIGSNIRNYNQYPRIVGETGGKDFIFAHPSADVRPLVIAMVRGAFEFQGQKCSAASRAYVPKSLWPRVRKMLLHEISTIKMGDPADFRNFMTAVIDKVAFESIKSYITYAKRSRHARIIAGGGCNDRKGYFIEPTVIVTKRPDFKTMREEIFGPVLTIYVYDDRRLEQTLGLVGKTSPYALTGAIFAQDRGAIVMMTEALRDAAGNFYINDKPTGAVVNQQPFGGSRASGTNDKAGSLLNMIRWTSPRTIKETFCPPKDYRYPFMTEE
jgi:1-pyrroline-5-carboxylate dehydrogenase